MNPTAWTERRAKFYLNVIDSVESLKHRRGRKPKELEDMQRIISDADFRRQIKAITFTELESKFDFWLTPGR